ncbi:hypothetical protein [Isoptericola croceus]|uniref:hypothetical protein n=1 Tax=Isoptericola croceus TaxID=3031406 RepID=UPI0023F68FA2|nr:hypothetical protein [Isoptericola croceus]
MPVRAVVLPATVLLVPGAAGLAPPLEPVRAAVLAEVARCVGPDGGAPARWGVLAAAARDSVGRCRPSLAGAGIADRWVPGLDDGWPAARAAVLCGVPASVALLVLAEAAGRAAAVEALVVELAPTAAEDRLAAAVDALADCDAVLVAAGAAHRAVAGPSAGDPAVTEVQERLAERSGWVATRRPVPAAGPHLPGRYDVVTWGTPAGPSGQNRVSANQSTPASSSQNRAARPTRTVGT